MKHQKLDEMIKGWFVGDFNPTIIPTKDFEVAVKYYRAGDREERHHHKVATELTVIVNGKVRMNSVEYSQGDIITIEPGESTDFEALTDVATTVVKVPSVKGDKYPGDG